MPQTSFIDALLPEGFGRNERLERIGKLIDWAPLTALASSTRVGGTGRPPYEALAMLKGLLLQQWYGLSDPEMEEALLDRMSFRRFCGFALDAATPDETTFCRFRNALKEAGLGAKRELFFGYKGRLGVRAGYGQLRWRVLTTAKSYESGVADESNIGDE